MKFLGFGSPDGHFTYKFTVKMDVGRLGAPAGGPRPFLTTVAACLAAFLFGREEPKLALNGFGRASRAANDFKTTTHESVKC